MNILKQSSTEQNIYFFKDCHLNSTLVSQLANITLIHTNEQKVILNTRGIKSVDAVGLAWLVNLVISYQKAGIEFILTENKTSL